MKWCGFGSESPSGRYCTNRSGYSNRLVCRFSIHLVYWHSANMNPGLCCWIQISYDWVRMLQLKHTHTYIHTYSHTHVYTRTHVHIRSHAHTHVHTNTTIDLHPHTHTQFHTYSRICTTHTRAQHNTHILTYTHTHSTHIYTQREWDVQKEK